MGCWNATCGVTNLPIYSGQEVMSWALVVRRKSAYSDYLGGGFSYPHELAAPLWFPVAGHYNDYGGTELNIAKDSAQNALFQKYLSRLSEKIVFDPEASEYSTKEAKAALASMNMESFYNDCVERSAIFLPSTFNGEPEAVCIFHVHKAVYEEMLQVFLQSAERHYDYSTEKFVKRTNQDYYGALIHAYVESSLQKAKMTPEERLESMMDDNKDGLWVVDDYLRRFAHHHLLKDVLFKDAAFLEQHKDLIEAELLNAVVWSILMGSLRIHWTPLSGGGSQEDSIKLHSELYKAIGRQIRKNKTHWD